MARPRAGVWVALSSSVWLLALLTTPSAFAQYTGPVQQDGRLLEANTYLGNFSGNYQRPASPLSLGNAAAFGTIGRGFSLRSFSPISAPTAFRGSLGSSSLSAFRRDSVAAGDANLPLGGLGARPYFDPDTTVFSAGLLNPNVRNTEAFAPGSTAAGFNAGGVPDARIRTANPLAASISGVNIRARSPLGSSIFGPRSIRTTNAAIDTWDRRTTTGLAGVDPLNPFGRRPSIDDNRALDATPREAPEYRPDPLGSRTLDVSPAEAVRRNRTLPMNSIQEPVTNDLFRPLQLTNPQNERPLVQQTPILADTPSIAEAPVAPPILTQTDMLPGNDLFTDMRLALALEIDPGAQWFREMQSAIRSDPVLSESLHARAQLDADAFLSAMRDNPIRSLSGGSTSALNTELVKAQSLMDMQQYYEAADRYETAHRLDPTNPLPLLGKGHAQLAAGDYRTAAVSLQQGLQRYPELAKFSFDLLSLMGGGEAVDIRRADLKKRLTSQDDPQLRFLLGYLEYYAGDRESGLQHLESAAQAVRPGTIIANLPGMLRGRGSYPPPQIRGSSPSSWTQPRALPTTPVEPGEDRLLAPPRLRQPRRSLFAPPAERLTPNRGRGIEPAPREMRPASPMERPAVRQPQARPAAERPEAGKPSAPTPAERPRSTPKKPVKSPKPAKSSKAGNVDDDLVIPKPKPVSLPPE